MQAHPVGGFRCSERQGAQVALAGAVGFTRARPEMSWAAARHASLPPPLARRRVGQPE